MTEGQELFTVVSRHYTRVYLETRLALESVYHTLRKAVNFETSANDGIKLHANSLRAIRKYYTISKQRQLYDGPQRM